MRWFTSGEVFLAAATLLSATATANPLSPKQVRSLLRNRAFSDSPTGGYAPGFVPCPKTPLVRQAKSISELEKDWVAERKEHTDRALIAFLNRASMIDFDIAAYMSDNSPTIALAFSGGGYRAMLSGGGGFAAMDSRTPDSTKSGHVGGLVQAATYVAGLSGGSWLLGSVVLNNFTTIPELQASEEVWDLRNSILSPEGILKIVDTAQYYRDIHEEVLDKENAGFDTSLTDYWGRAISRQFIGIEDGGPGVTFSSIADTETFRNFEMPFPIVVADGRHPGETIISTNATVFEFNPFEFGSFDPTLYAFTQLEFIGTNVTNGVPNDPDVCAKGYDNAGFILGTSSSLFNIGLLLLDSSGVEGILKDFAEGVLAGLSESEADIADYDPNPFFGVNPGINPSAQDTDLTLVDGGLDGQNIPLHPLIQPARKVDVIFACDASADINNWPNGTALVATYARSLSPMQNKTHFPAIPDQNTFVNRGLNTRPTFFGCDLKNITKEEGQNTPLVVYIPNAPITFFSNVTTFDPDYETNERDGIIRNGYDVMTRGNGTADKEWPACVGCAIVHRGLERAGKIQTEQCKRCFERYCWDGVRDEEAPEKPYEPTLLIAGKSGAGTVKGGISLGLVGWIVVGFVGWEWVL